ncbi:hypothetical protein N0V84_009552 [Fusarium piperis]|uniref:Uncharacterized protein n=1 Tax=Fusarium piperis TaxID=1435070 RepID=A0A9W9BHZ1_9HYPO|nr:hypothetical protein N0V84_009552 [Fusarium piperis]
MTSFESLGDLNKAIDEAVKNEKVVLEEHPHRPDVLMLLSNLLFERCKMAGSLFSTPLCLHWRMVDLDQAIRATNMAVEGLPAHGFSWFTNVHNLRIMLKMRLGSTSTEMAAAQAADMNGEDARGDDPGQAGLWYTLAKRFRDTSEIIPEDRAIDITEAMWKVTSSQPPGRPFILARLASNTHTERAGIIGVLVQLMELMNLSNSPTRPSRLRLKTLQPMSTF